MNQTTLMQAPLSSLQKAGIIANMSAQQGVFERYMRGKAAATIARQADGLALFRRYIEDAGIALACADFQHDPECWRGVTWGIVEGFLAWQLQQGYAVSSANVRLSTVKTYARLAAKAGVISSEDWALIQAVKGYSRKEAGRVDEKRQVVRVGQKKEAAVVISAEQAKALMEGQPDTPQGRRDALLMCLLLEHGLRASEAAALTRANVNLVTGELRFYRPKVSQETTHKLTARTLLALHAYLPDAPEAEALLVASRRGGALAQRPLTRVTLSRRVQTLGAAVGAAQLSAHDCRHYCATDMAGRGYSVKMLMQWFGWASPVMAMRYIADQDVLERDKG